MPEKEVKALLVELAATRDRGFGLNHGESEPGVVAMAVPLTMPYEIVGCSLTISGPASRINPHKGDRLSARESELLTMLRESATSIENELTKN